MSVLAHARNLEVRLATTGTELRAAQTLRYRVFYEELGAIADPATRRGRKDEDRFDRFADHLLVVDSARSTESHPCVVGCYRLLREEAARRAGGFYTEDEYDLSPLRARRRLLELGRSCIAPAYRNGAAMQLLWQGIAVYQERHGIELMLGCAGLPGTDIAAVAGPIRHLHEHHLAPLGMRPVAHSHRRVAHEPFASEVSDRATALRNLPTLIKGYLRVGAMIGEGAVLDEAFNTIDVCIVLPTERIGERYRQRYAVPGAELVSA